MIARLLAITSLGALLAAGGGCTETPDYLPPCADPQVACPAVDAGSDASEGGKRHDASADAGEGTDR